jgi:integrase
VRLRDLGIARARDWRTAILSDGCPPTQANKAARVLSAALGVAVAEGLLPANPLTRLRALPVADRRPRVLVPRELEAIRARMTTHRDIVMLGLLSYAGLRPGEALALRWRDVDRLLVIDRAVSDGQLREATKTYQRRTVEIVAPLGDDLERLRPKAAAPDALVIAGRDGQVLDLSHWRSRVLARAAAAADLLMTPYDGRHSCASLLIHEGRSLAYVAAFLGHASVTTTARHYTHLIEESRLGTAVPMVEAIDTARADLERQGVYPMCTKRWPSGRWSPIRSGRSHSRSGIL